MYATHKNEMQNPMYACLRVSCCVTVIVASQFGMVASLTVVSCNLLTILHHLLGRFTCECSECLFHTISGSEYCFSGSGYCFNIFSSGCSTGARGTASMFPHAIRSSVVLTLTCESALCLSPYLLS